MRTEFLQSLKHCRTLPSMPVLAIQILSMCQNPKADSKKMAELISHDPAFAAKLLSLANSGFYARIQHQITNLAQGVTLLGREAVAVLAFSFSLYRNLRGEDLGDFDHQGFWRRSILSGIAGRALAKHHGYENYEEVFLAALLQDIGMLALSVVSAERYPLIVQRAAHHHPFLQELERQEFGMDHAEVGAWLAQEWKLPDLFHHAIGQSHGLTDMGAFGQAGPLAKYVVVSSSIADIWCWPETERAIEEAVSLTSEVLNEGAAIVDSILHEMAESIPHISALFEIDLGMPDEIQRVLHSAKELLLQATADEN